VYSAFAVFVARRKLTRGAGHAQTIAIDLSQHPDPMAAIEDRVGPLASLQILYLPLGAALAMLRSMTGDISAQLEAALRLFYMAGVEQTLDHAPDFGPAAWRHFANRPIMLPNGWTAAGELDADTEAQARNLIAELKLISTHDTLERVVAAALAIDPTAREWVPSYIAAVQRQRLEFIPRSAPNDGKLIGPRAHATWVDAAGAVHEGDAPITSAQLDYARRIRELQFIVRGQDGTTYMDKRTGAIVPRPRVAEIVYSVDNDVEEWAVVDAVAVYGDDDDAVEFAEAGRVA
jgi:hypothetical protein